jgi:hypothetical protein
MRLKKLSKSKKNVADSPANIRTAYQYTPRQPTGAYNGVYFTCTQRDYFSLMTLFITPQMYGINYLLSKCWK